MTKTLFQEKTGVYNSVDEAVQASKVAFSHLNKSIGLRDKIVKSIRSHSLKNCKKFASMALEETGYGRYDDKIKKNLLAINATPGVEDINPSAYTGEHGTTLVECAPYGLIAAVTPSTNPSETIINNAISMIAAGNAVVFSPHPSAKNTTTFCVSVINNAIVQAGGPRNLITCLGNPTKENSEELMRHPDIRLNVVTGGEGAVKRAMSVNKRCVAAGPGNPPVIVDETANIAEAARDIIEGASFDNGIVCILEKEVIAVDSIADQLIDEMRMSKCYLASEKEINELLKFVFTDISSDGKHGRINREFVGKNASVLLKQIGVGVSDDVRLIIAETDRDNPLVWTEMLMPILPIVRVNNVDDAIDFGMEVEQKCYHTAVMHSKNIDKLSKMSHECDCTIFVSNAPSLAGLGYNGEGYTSYTISSPTGEGITSAKSFTRQRRCTLAKSFRII